MNDCQCSHACEMRLELKDAIDKLAFIRDNWPSFGQPECLDNLSDMELRCILCLFDTVIEGVTTGEYTCSARDAVRLQISRTIIDNDLQIREFKRQRAELEELDRRLDEELQMRRTS